MKITPYIFKRIEPETLLYIKYINKPNKILKNNVLKKKIKNKKKIKLT